MRQVTGGKWKDELKLQVYRDCFEVLQECSNTSSMELIRALQEKGIDVSPRRAVYVRKDKGLNLVTMIGKYNILFGLSDVAFPHWKGWKMINAAVNSIEFEDDILPAEVNVIGLRGCCVDILDQTMNLLCSSRQSHAIAGWQQEVLFQ